MLSLVAKNLPLKLLSIFLAILLWSVISRGRGGETMEIGIGIPVELHNLPADMEVMRGPVERVSVRFTGPRRTVSRISQLGLSIPVDLTGAAEGETTIELFNSDIKTPERVNVTRISPSSVTVLLERTAQKEVPVQAVLKGQLMEGYALSTVSLTPTTVVISGPRTVIDPIEEISTAAITVEKAVGDLTGETSLVFPAENVHPLKMSTVRYEIRIVQTLSAGE